MYAYDSNDLRTSRTNGTTTYEYVYNGSSLVQLVVNYATESETASRDVLYFTSNTVTYNGTTYYYIKNLQGDVVAILNSDGNAVVTYSYDAWGNIIDITGSMMDTLGTLNPLRYRGYVYDSETSLYYLQSRYYDPEMGRFLGHDVVYDTDAGLQGFNLFVYCGNNPINRIDISGADSDGIGDGEDMLDELLLEGGAPGNGNPSGGGRDSGGNSIGGGIGGSVSSGSSAGSIVRAVLEELDCMLRMFSQTMQDGVSFMMYGGVRTSPNIITCFVAGTLVQTESGSKPIEDICAGDLVWAWDEDSGDVALKEVVETYVNETYELVRMFVNGEEIVTTPSHPFYSPVKGWTDAVHLRAGDILVLVNGEYVVVEKVQHEILESPVTVYNFQVEDYHTYYVADAGVLVHNSCERGVGGKGWKGDKTWRKNVRTVSEGGDILELDGGVPTGNQARQLITESGGIVGSYHSAHAVGGISNHTYNHIHYYTESGIRSAIHVLFEF